MPRSFTPTSSKFAGELCHGLTISITDRSMLDSLRVGFEIAIALRDQFPHVWEGKGFSRLIGNQKVFDAFLNGATWQQMKQLDHRRLEDFLQRRKEHLIYE